MTITTGAIIIGYGLAIVAWFVAWMIYKSGQQTKAERDYIKAMADRYLKEIANQNTELAARQKLIDEIQGADHEADERKDKIEKAGHDPRDRFNATMGVMSDIASGRPGADSDPGDSRN